MSIEKEGFKEVRIGPEKKAIPSDWKLKRMEDIVEFHKGRSPMPKSDSSLFGGDLPYLKIVDISNSEKYIRETEEHVTEKGAKESRLFPEGVLVVSIYGATRGKIRILKTDSYSHEGVVGFYDLKKSIDKEFLYYLLQNKNLGSRGHGAAQKNLNISILDKLKLPKPQLTEQKKIAEVLSTVDEAIQKTEEIIERTKELKKGLMQDLLNEGIGHEDFKEVQLGPKTIEIPEEWNVKSLGEVCDKVTDGTHDTPKTQSDGYPFITAKHITKGKIDFESCLYISRKDHKKNISRCKPEKGDLLFTHIGTIGEVVRIKDSRTFSIKNIALFKPNNSLVSSKYLESFLKSRSFQDQVYIVTQGGVQNFLGLSTLRKLPVILPKLTEQRKIANVLSTVDQKIQKEKDHKEKLEKLKKGLMQDLLTGKVRVLPLLSDEEKEELKGADVTG